MSAGGRAPKKVQRREDEPPDDGRDEMMMDDQRQKAFSFKYAVLNNRSESSNLNSEWKADDLKLNVDDVQKVVADGVTIIDFFKQVYSLIDESMSKPMWSSC